MAKGESKVAKCMWPNCTSDNPSRTRGLCPTCYRMAANLVKEGQVSWDELEESGRVSPSKKTVTDWLLEGALEVRRKRGQQVSQGEIPGSAITQPRERRGR